MNKGFLTDKKYWVEENEKDYTLCVEHNGKVYRSSIKKSEVNFINQSEEILFKESVIVFLVSEIESEISLDKQRELLKELRNIKNGKQ